MKGEQGSNQKETKRIRSSLKDKQRTKSEEAALLDEQKQHVNHLINERNRIQRKNLFVEQAPKIQIKLKQPKHLKQQTVRMILKTLGPQKYKNLPTMSTNKKLVQTLLKEQIINFIRWTSSKSTYKIKNINKLVTLLEDKTKRRDELIKKLVSWVVKLGSDDQYRQQWRAIQKEVVQLIFQAQRLGRIAESFIQLIKNMPILAKIDKQQLKKSKVMLTEKFLQLHNLYRNYALMLRQPQFEQILKQYGIDKKDSIEQLVTSVTQIIQLLEGKSKEIQKLHSEKSSCFFSFHIDQNTEEKRKNVSNPDLLLKRIENENDLDKKDSYSQIMSWNPQNKNNCSRKDDTTLQKKHSKEIRHPYGTDRTSGDFSHMAQNQQKFPCEQERIFDCFDFNPPYWKYVTPQQI